MKKNVIFLVGLILLFFTQESGFATSFQNGTFDSDFQSWLGELQSADSNGYILIHDGLDPDADEFILDADGDGTLDDPAYTNNYFTIDTQRASLTNDSTFFNVYLYQDFDMDTLTPGWSMDISFWIKWTPTDSTSDSLSAALEETSNTSNYIDLLDGISTSDLTDGVNVTVDITSWAGKNVELYFGLLDYDWDYGDNLLIDDISINKHPAPVPEPGTLFLLGAGFLPVCLLRKKNN